jgi:hypothetical protein
VAGLYVHGNKDLGTFWCGESGFWENTHMFLYGSVYLLMAS